MTKRSLITESDVQQVIREGHTIFYIDGDAIITPLAENTLKEHKIEVVRQQNMACSPSQIKNIAGITELGCPDEPVNIAGRDRMFLIDLLKSMIKVRDFEKAMGVLFREKHLVGFLHLSIGQEAVSVGACKALNPDDYLTLTHRGHGQMVARGSDLNMMAAELLGRATGYCKGKGGSLHLADFQQGILGANGIVAAGIVIATGAAMSAKIRRTRQVTLAFFGDGAVNQGAFHESLNYASVMKLPALYVCENNQYAVSTACERSMSSTSIAARGAAYGMASYRIDGQNVLLVHDTIKEAADRARNGDGPSLIECLTYRTRGHWEGETTDLRPAEEKEKWKKRDAIFRLEKALLDNRQATADEMEKVHDQVHAQVADAVRYAEQSPYPGPEEVLRDVYSSEVGALCAR